ncbi:DUF5808 domain-containing protein [Desemzia incerta]|uniref:DUF1648 domain-containing protein n=1 Tax=Desemzia incerta TaxID=82801 RepID=UPI0024C2D98B|nr:DUF5808 domain-containing protein [Desemzia incerta]WHZ32280.1 DUF5808 domain-containing protein [Desemzia incerta]
MWLFYSIMIGIFLILGFVNGLTPYYSRRGTPFGITVPSSHQQDSFIQMRKKRFFIQNVLLSILLSIPIVFFSNFEDQTAQDMWSGVYVIGAMLVFFVLTFVLYLQNRKAIQLWKKEEQIIVETKKERIVVDTNYHRDLNAVSTRTIVIVQLVIVLISVAVIGFFYDRIPNQFPIHWNSQNIPDRSVEKSPLSVMMMPAMQLLMIPVLAFSHYAFIKSKQKLLANYPQITSYQSKKFRRAWSINFLVTSIATQLLLTSTNFFSLFFAEDMAFGWMGLLIGIFIFGIVGYSSFLTWKYGQGGEKLVFSEIDEPVEEVTEVDEEKYWKLGMFYYNSEDPAIFVEKRFGIGSTINLARWQSWACIAGLIFFCIFIGVIPLIME